MCDHWPGANPRTGETAEGVWSTARLTVELCLSLSSPAAADVGIRGWRDASPECAH